MSQLSSTMMSQMTAEGSQSSMLLLNHGPLPDSEFVQNNRPRARPGVPLTTATKAGRQAAAVKKGKASKKIVKLMEMDRNHPNKGRQPRQIPRLVEMDRHQLRRRS